MMLMEMKKREQGSTTFDCKSKGLQAHWFTVGQKITATEDVNDDSPPAKIERGTVVGLEDGSKFVVMGIFNKFHNKWFLMDQKQKKKDLIAELEKAKPNLRFHVRKLHYDRNILSHRLAEGDGTAAGNALVFKQITFSDVKKVEGNLSAVEGLQCSCDRQE